MWDMMQSDMYVRVLAGPVGSGKSVCASHELMKLSMMQAPNADGLRKTRTLIVRNTADQLKSTTMKTFFDWFPPGQWGTYVASQNKTYFVKQRLPDSTTIDAEFMFIALDTPDDVRKALSLEATFLWGNEWRELHPDVVDGLLMRLRRYPSGKDGGPTRSCALFDTNMPDQDSWHFEQMENPPDNWSVHTQPPAVLSYDEFVKLHGVAPDSAAAKQLWPQKWLNAPKDVQDKRLRAPARDGSGADWFVNPKADNVDNLDPLYYPDIIPGKTEDFVNVYLRCRYGRSLAGTPVYDKAFNPEFHVAAEPLNRLAYTMTQEYPIVCGIDFGRTPAAVFKQRDPRGRVLTLSEVVCTPAESMGIETFIMTKLNPHVAEFYAGCEIVCAPDPAGFMKQQLNELTLVDALKNAGYQCVKPPSNKPEHRIQAVERLLTLQVDGKAMYLIDPRCDVLVKGFKYGYRYKKKRGGQLENSPDKNEFSHVHDANQYADSVIDLSVRGVVRRETRREVRASNYMYA